MIRCRFIFLLSFAARLGAQSAIPESEALQPPTGARLAAIEAAARRDGWAPQTAMLHATAVRAYQLDQLRAAETWFHVYRWAALFGETEAHFVTNWIPAVNAAKVGHSNMPTRFSPAARPLGLALSPELQAWLLGNAAFSSEFFSLLAPVDYVPNVFQILNDLHHRDPARFQLYAFRAMPASRSRSPSSTTCRRRRTGPTARSGRSRCRGGFRPRPMRLPGGRTRTSWATRITGSRGWARTS